MRYDNKDNNDRRVANINTRLIINLIRITKTR